MREAPHDLVRQIGSILSQHEDVMRAGTEYYKTLAPSTR